MTKRGLFSRRNLIIGGAAAVGVGGLAFKLRHKLKARLSKYTQVASFTATPPELPHDPARDRTTIAIGQGGAPDANVDTAMAKLGGMSKFVGADDVVIIKLSAQWWNQGMTNVAAAKRTIEQVLEVPGFRGEIIVFENTHFMMPDGTGLSRAWTHASERNVDVPGWDKLIDLKPHFEGLGAPVSFVGLVDAGPSSLADSPWFDPQHEHGVYGGDDRGPIADGEDRDGYHWDFSNTFRIQQSWFEDAQTPLTWPRFTSPRTGIVVDLKDGLFTREGGKLVPVPGRKLTWINVTTANEHDSTGFTGACKSTMGVVDMSAGMMGTHALIRGYKSVHYFGRGNPSATWRMAGPLADFAKKVRSPDLILAVAEWVAYVPADYDGSEDIRQSGKTCTQKKTVVAGTDPVAIDVWCCNNLLHDVPTVNREELHELSPSAARVSKFTKFLRYYRQVWGRGAMDPALIDVV